MYYFINGYTSKLAGTEAGVTEPMPNFSPCFGGPFLPRPPSEYAEMLAERIKKYERLRLARQHRLDRRALRRGPPLDLDYTRAMITAILNGTLARETFDPDPIFGLHIPRHVQGVPAGILHPEDAWLDADRYRAQAEKLAEKFRENDQKFSLTDEVHAAGPKPRG